MQSVSSRIWTRVAVSISNDDNHYTTGTYKSPLYIYIKYMICKHIFLLTFLNEPKFILLYPVKWFQVLLYITVSNGQGISVHTFEFS